MMKKVNYIISALLASTALFAVGCTKDVTPESKDLAICFDASSAGTKASLSDLTDIRNNGFVVYANSYLGESTTKTPLFSNQAVAYASGVWSYSPTKFWPSADNADVDFYAVYTDGSDNVKMLHDWYNRPQTIFYVNDNVLQQTDMLWAAPQLGLSAHEYIENNKKVEFNFQHALTAFNFSIKLDDNWMVELAHKTVRVKSLSLTGYFAPKAQIVPDATNVKDAFKLEGDWEERTYTLSEVGSELSADCSTMNLTTTAVPVTAGEGYIMLLPFAQEFTLSIDYQVIDLNESESSGNRNKIYTISETVNTIPLEPGKVINIDITTLKLNAAVRSSASEDKLGMSLDINVQDWK